MSSAPHSPAIVIAVGRPGLCFILNAFSFLAVLAGLLAMRTNELYPVERRPAPSTSSGARAKGSSFAVARRQSLLLVVMTRRPSASTST